MVVVKWVGFALLAVALAVLPFTIWISTQWGIVSATAGLIGLVLLVIGLAGRRIEPGTGDPSIDIPPGRGGDELRGFPGANAFDQHGNDSHDT